MFSHDSTPKLIWYKIRYGLSLTAEELKRAAKSERRVVAKRGFSNHCMIRSQGDIAVGMAMEICCKHRISQQMFYAIEELAGT